jgi:poly(3-hydroxybutyrate) depolymerase
MQPLARNAGCFALAAALVAAAPAIAADLSTLPALNAPLGDSSVSGLSSGAFMAVQFGTAWSSVIKGVGVVSGGPYECAQDSAFGAVGPCMNGPPPPLHFFTETADEKAASGEIDPVSNLARQRVYVFHGTQDTTVVRDVTDETVAFYRHYIGDAATGHLLDEHTLAAGHAFVVPDTPATSGFNACGVTDSPYIVRCGDYDQAGVILRQIYGDLNPPAQPDALSASVQSFDQHKYAKPGRPAELSLANEGFVFVPKACADPAGPPCRVHVVLHGCEQNAKSIGRAVVDTVGFNGWADTNRIIVLYPQTIATDNGIIINPKACWDWWGYLEQDRNYFTKSGRQIQALKAMLDDLTGTPPAAGAH